MDHSFARAPGGAHILDIVARLPLSTESNGPRVGLDPGGNVAENDDVEIQGRVHDGVAVPERELPLPGGRIVTVVYSVMPGTGPAASGQRVRLPLVPSDRPGSLRLDADRVAELLEDGDVAS